MARDRLATAAIITCMVAAVSTLPALLIAGSIPQPVENDHYQTTNTTNVIYNVNGTDTIVSYECASCHVSPTKTRTLTRLSGQDHITIDQDQHVALYLSPKVANK